MTVVPSPIPSVSAIGPKVAASLWLVTLLPMALPMPIRAGTLGDTVRSICLSAVQREMERAGKEVPAGMADFACSCVLDRLEDGTSLDAARHTCRLATVKRYLQ